MSKIIEMREAKAKEGEAKFIETTKKAVDESTAKALRSLQEVTREDIISGDYQEKPKRKVRPKK